MRRFLGGFFGKAILALLLVFAIAAIVQATTDGYQPMRQAGDPAIGLYKSSPSTLSDGEYDPVRLTSAGLLRTSLDGSAATGASSLTIQGTASTAAALSGKPVRIGASDGTNAVDVACDPYGQVKVIPASQGSWAVYHNPAANTTATISKAAGTGSVKHVIDGFDMGITGDGTGGADVVTCVVRDGATGAGTIIYSTFLTLPAGVRANGTHISAPLHFVGTAATAATIETTTTVGTHSQVSVSLWGHDEK